MGEEAKGTDKVLYFVFGALVGAAAALLIAPRNGEETRRLILTKARENADRVVNRTRSAAEKTAEYVDRGKEVIQHQRDQLAAAVEAGKQAYRDEKNKAQT